jgi:hypothetical protein
MGVADRIRRVLPHHRALTPSCLGLNAVGPDQVPNVGVAGFAAIGADVSAI